MAILTELKTFLGVPGTSFDIQLLQLINSELLTLRQLGVDDFMGIVVTDSTDWPISSLPLDVIELYKTCLMHGVSISFDPSANNSLLQSRKEYLKESRGRLMIAIEIFNAT